MKNIRVVVADTTVVADILLRSVTLVVVDLTLKNAMAAVTVPDIPLKQPMVMEVAMVPDIPLKNAMEVATVVRLTLKNVMAADNKLKSVTVAVTTLKNAMVVVVTPVVTPVVVFKSWVVDNDPTKPLITESHREPIITMVVPTKSGRQNLPLKIWAK